MAYSTGTAVTLKDVLSILATWLGTVTGWTVDHTAADKIVFHNTFGSYFKIQWFVGGSGPYWEFWTATAGTAHAGAGNLTNGSPGVGITMAGTSPTSPPTLAPNAYFFFADTTSVFVVVAVAAHDYQVLNMQSVDKVGTWPGGNGSGAGTFIGGYPDGVSPASFDSSCWFRDTDPVAYLRMNGAWKVLGTDFGTLQGGAANQPDYVNFRDLYRADIDGRPALPYVLWVNDGAGDSWPAGAIRRCRYLIKTGLSPRQVIQVGSTDYMVFPGQHATDAANARIGLEKD